MAAPPAPPGTPRPSPTRAPLVRHPGRVAVVVLTIASVITLGVWALTSAETDTGRLRDAPRLPATVESVSPGPGELGRPQDTVTADLRDGLTGVLVIDGVEIPEDQLERVVPLGQMSFRAGPDQEIERFDPGEHTVTVLYWRQDKERPARPAAYTWTFRTGA